MLRVLQASDVIGGLNQFIKLLILGYAVLVLCVVCFYFFFLLKFLKGLLLARKQFLFLYRSSQLRVTSTIPDKFCINWGAGNGRRALPFCCQSQQLLVWQKSLWTMRSQLADQEDHSPGGTCWTPQGGKRGEECARRQVGERSS